MKISRRGLFGGLLGLAGVAALGKQKRYEPILGPLIETEYQKSIIIPYAHSSGRIDEGWTTTTSSGQTTTTLVYSYTLPAIDLQGRYESG